MGLLDVTIVRDASRLTLISALRLVYDGSHRTLDLCSFHRGRDIEIVATGRPVGMEIDGGNGRFDARLDQGPAASAPAARLIRRRACPRACAGNRSGRG